jgi:hypothetical protein
MELPPLERGHIEPDYSQLLTYPAADTVLREALTHAPAYRALGERDCQCRAVAVANQAQLLDLEAEAIDAKRWLTCGCGTQCANRRDCLQKAVLGYRAREDRNRAAGATLELYYKLAEAEGRWDLLALSLVEIERTLRQAESMRKQGLELPVEIEALRRQRLDLQTEEVKIEQGVQQLNDELRRRLRLDTSCGDSWRIWPNTGFPVSLECPDVEAAVGLGMERRAELQLLRAVLHELDGCTEPVAALVIQTSTGAPTVPSIRILAILLSPLRPIYESLCGDTPLVAVRRRQLQVELAQQEHRIADEIRNAVRNAEAEAYQVVLLRERVRSWELKVSDLERRAAQGIAAFAELSQARLELLKTRSDLTKEVMAWETARVKIRQAQGILVDECTDGACAAH